MELPLVTHVSRPNPHSLVLTLDIQPELRCFQGHFVMAPILAGVVQIDWVVRLASEYFGTAFVFRGMQSIKFLQLVHPPLTLTLGIDYLPERGLLKFSYRDQLATYSSGGIRLDLPVDPAEVSV